jgi:group I intron endonuclease
MAVKKLIVPKHITGLRHYVYAHTTVDTKEVFYIGLGTVQSKSKYTRSKSLSGRNNYWKKVSSKHGYTITIFAESSDYEEAKNLEKHYISVLGLRTAGGCLVNATLGGDGCLGYKHTQEHKDKLKTMYSGENNPMFGKRMSEEEKKSRSKMISGLNNPRYGKVGSENPRSRQVFKLDPITREVLYTYESVRQAALKEEVSHTSIRKAVNNKTQSKNHYWSYGS